MCYDVIVMNSRICLAVAILGVGHTFAPVDPEVGKAFIAGLQVVEEGDRRRIQINCKYADIEILMNHIKATPGLGMNTLAYLLGKKAELSSITNIDNSLVRAANVGGIVHGKDAYAENIAAFTVAAALNRYLEPYQNPRSSYALFKSMLVDAGKADGFTEYCDDYKKYRNGFYQEVIKPFSEKVILTQHETGIWDVEKIL